MATYFVNYDFTTEGESEKVNNFQDALRELERLKKDPRVSNVRLTVIEEREVTQDEIDKATKDRPGPRKGKSDTTEA
jgi:hypothetical protein